MPTGEKLHNEVLRHIVMVNYSAKSIIIAFCLVLVSYRPQLNTAALVCASLSLVTMWGGQIFYTAFWTPWENGGITRFFSKENDHVIKDEGLKRLILFCCCIYYAGFAVFYITTMLNDTDFVNPNPIFTACAYATVAWHFYQCAAFFVILVLRIFDS